MKDNRLKETKKKITKEKGQNSRRQKMTIDVAFKSLQIVIDMKARSQKRLFIAEKSKGRNNYNRNQLATSIIISINIYFYDKLT